MERSTTMNIRRFPPDLLRQIKMLAAFRGISLRELVVAVLDREVAGSGIKLEEVEK